MEHLIFTAAEHDVRLTAVAYLDERGAEGFKRDFDHIAVVEFADELLEGVVHYYADLVAGSESDLHIEVPMDDAALPFLTAGGDEAFGGSAACNGALRIVSAAGEEHTGYENIAVAAVEVVDAREMCLLVIAHEPRVTVNLGGEDKASSERLEDEIVLEIVDAGGNADAVILRQAEKARRVAAVEEVSAVMGRGDRVSDEHVNVGLLTAPEERGGVLHSLVAEPEPVVEEDEIG